MSYTYDEDYLIYEIGNLKIRMFFEIERDIKSIMSFLVDFIDRKPCSIGLNKNHTVEITLFDDRETVDIEIAATKTHNGTMIMASYYDCKDAIIKALLTYINKQL